MIGSQQKEYPDLGVVEYRHSKKSRRLRITLKPFKNITIAVPVRVSFQEAEKFLLSRSDWITKNNSKIRGFEAQVKLAREEISPINYNEAKASLKQRALQLAEEYGFKINRITIRNQKTRWGSCSCRKNINLNVNLIHLPAELRDHVILHELIHTRIGNHSPEFWQELEKYSSESKLKKKQLKRYQYLIYQEKDEL